MKNRKLMTKTVNGRTFKVYYSNDNLLGTYYVREYSKDAFTKKRKLECEFYCNDLNSLA